MLIIVAERALEAPIVRRIFTSSPRDPRYHMLSHISAKFAQSAKSQQHEPRAAMFLNRFTRTLTIMYATTGIEEIVGIPAESIRGRSFYYCIAENCLNDAVKCLENAKGNDSIAYLRFWFRDPRQDDIPPPPDDEDSDEEMTTDVSIDESEGGVDLQSRVATSSEGDSPTLGRVADGMDIDDETKPDSRTSSNESGDSTAPQDTHAAIFGHGLTANSSDSSLEPWPERQRRPPVEAIEIEAVISCTSDGLVVCLRKARPMLPHPTHRPSKPVYENGLFAAPWATEPTLPPIESRPGAGFGNSFAPSLGPQGAHHNRMSPPKASHDQSDFMKAIRDQAIFAWALTSINGALQEYGSGKPLGESLPEHGLPVWASDSRRSTDLGRNDSGNWNGGNDNFGSTSRSPENGRAPHIFGDPGLGRNGTVSKSASSGYSTGAGGTPYEAAR